MSKLEVLRLANTPDYGTPSLIDEDYIYAWCSHQVANDIIGYLGDRGSPIELLALSPLQEHPSCSQDPCDQLNLAYYFLRADSSISQPGRTVLVTAVALPIKKEQILDYVEDAKVIIDRRGWQYIGYRDCELDWDDD